MSWRSSVLWLSGVAIMQLVEENRIPEFDNMYLGMLARWWVVGD